MQLAAVIAHEVAHIRRGDYAINLLHSAVEVPLFFSPAVVWISRCIRDAREFCCDDEAAAIGDRRHYVEALTCFAALGATEPRSLRFVATSCRASPSNAATTLLGPGASPPDPLHTLSLAASTARSGRVRDFASLVAISRSRRSDPAFALPVVAQRAKAGVNRS
jgi:hypothetical protein